MTDKTKAAREALERNADLPQRREDYGGRVMKTYQTVIKDRWGKPLVLENNSLSKLKEEIKGRRIRQAFIIRNDNQSFRSMQNKYVETYVYRPRY